MDLGIIGLARSGKTSFFNAVTGGKATVGAFSSQQEPNVGVAHVPDERVDRLAAVFKPKKVTYAEIRWVDYPTAGFGPQGPGHRFLNELLRMDALVHVVRAFEDPAVPHPDGSVDPHRDFDALNLELTFADLALIERRIERIDAELRSTKSSERGRLERDRALMLRLQAALEDGGAIRALELTEDERADLNAYQFVTRLPMLLVINVGEEDLGRVAEIEAAFAARYAAPGVAVAALSARLEAELATLEPEEAASFRADLGLSDQSPRDRAIQLGYSLLGMQWFLTAVEEECRAWTVRAGASAPEAAGKIHSDLERGFIRAEVARWDELVAAGTTAELKKRGRLRTEGKDYVVQDGDVLNILFNL